MAQELIYLNSIAIGGIIYNSLRSEDEYESDYSSYYSGSEDDYSHYTRLHQYWDKEFLEFLQKIFSVHK